jgi:putative transposase
MPNYRRLFQPNGTWFFTVNLKDRSSGSLVKNYTLLRNAVFRVKRKHPFTIEAMVILPDHIHAILTLPPGDTDFPMRWRLIKARYSKACDTSEERSAVQIRRRERAIWQRRYWEHLIRDEADFANHVDYCYWNPIKHRLVERVGDWPYSTYHRDVRCGRYERDCMPGEIPTGEFGENRRAD